MKTKLFTCQAPWLAFAFFLFLHQVYAQQGQLRNWYLFQAATATGKSIAFTGTNGAPQIGANLPTNSTHSGYYATNAYYSETGDLVFYVVSSTNGVYVYDKNNNIIKNDVYTQVYFSPAIDYIERSEVGDGNEIGIIPIPGSCSRFHLVIGARIFEMQLGSVTAPSGTSYTYGAIMSTLNNSSGATMGLYGNLSTGLISYFYGGGGGTTVTQTAFAINKPASNKYSVYYLMGCNNTSNGLYRTEIDYSTNPATISVNQQFVASYTTLGLNSPCGSKVVSDMELSPNGQYVATATDNKVSVRNLVSNTSASVTVSTASFRITGLEFDKNSGKLVIAGYYMNSPTNDFVFVWDFINNPTGSATALANSADYVYTQLELGRDGEIYGMAPGKLGKADLTTSQMTTALTFSGFTVPYSFVYSSPFSGYKVMCLPDQIDGYQYFQLTSSGQTYTVSQNPLPRCGSGPVTLTASGASAGNVYKWYNGTSNDVVYIGNPFTTNVTANATFTVTSVGVNGCENSSRKSHAVTVYNITPSFNVSSPMCQGASIGFIDNTNPGSLTITNRLWNFGNGISGYGGSSTTYTYPNSGSYQVTLTIETNVNCSFSTTQNINVKAKPTAQFNVGTPKCEQANVQFTDASSVSGSNIVSYLWDFGGGNTSTLANPTFIFATSGSHPVQLKVTSADNCEATVTNNVVIDPKPTANFSYPSPICQWQAAQFTDNSTVGSGSSIVSWQWSGGGATSGSQNPLLTIQNYGVVNVMLTVTTDKGCTDAVNIAGTIKEAPVVNFSTGTSLLCEFENVQFQGSISIGSPNTITTYNWNFGDPTSYYDNTSTLLNPTHFFAGTSSGIYAFPVKFRANASNGCFRELTQNITIHPSPSAEFELTDKCLTANPFQFTNLSNILSGTMTYLWNFGDPASGSNNTSTATNPSHTFSTMGNIYTVTLNAISNYGCSASKTHNIKSEFKPTVTLGLKSGYTSSSICRWGQLELEALPNTSNSTYEWFWPATNPLAFGSCTTNELTIAPSSICLTSNSALKDDLGVRARNYNGCESAMSILNIEVYDINIELTTPGYTGAPDYNVVRCSGAPVTLSFAVPSPAQTYQWEEEVSGTFVPISGAGSGNTFTPTTNGRYRAIVTAYHNGGATACTGTSDIFNVVDKDPLQIVRKTGAFTPATPETLEVDPSNNAYMFYTNLSWYRDGKLVGLGYDYVATLPGKYVVTGSSFCGYEVSNEIELRYDCSTSGITLSSSLPGGNYSNPAYIIPPGTTVQIQPGPPVVFNNTSIVAGACSRIEVLPGASLSFNNVIASGCDDWEGIVVSASTSLRGTFTMSGSNVSFAYIGVYSNAGGQLDISTSTFSNNQIHVGFGAYTPIHSSKLLNNVFSTGHTSICTYPISLPSFSFNEVDVFLQDVNGVDIKNNQFEYSPNLNIISGIPPSTYNGKVSLWGDNVNNALIEQNNFAAEVEYGIYLKNPSACNIRQNHFYGNRQVGNSYQSLVNGLYMKRDEASIVLSNVFVGTEIGMECYMPLQVFVTTQIAQNLFSLNNYGLVIAPDENPLNAPVGSNGSGSPIEVNINCNKFYSNVHGIAGSGNLIQQGNSLLDAANDFVTNSNWDVVWQNVTAPVYYYDPSPAPSVTGSPVLLNGFPTSSTFNANSTSAGAVTCFGSWKRSQKPIVEGKPDKPKAAYEAKLNPTVRMYPNPFNGDISITYTGLNKGTWSFEVIDVFGRIVYTQSNITEDELKLNTTTWKAGVYFMHVRGAGLQYEDKLLKIGN